MKTLTLDLSGIYSTVTPESIQAWEAKSNQYQQQLHAGTGLGNDFLGWINLPIEISEADLSAIEEAAHDLQQRCDYVVSIGIGGSYLGARAVIEALTPSFEAYQTKHTAPQVIFAGHNIGEDYLSELVTFLTRSPVVAMIVEGPSDNTWELGRILIGKTQVTDAQPGSIRGDFATTTNENLVHGSDGPESAEREIALWFPGR